MATRWRCPPESSLGLWCMRSARPTSSQEVFYPVLPLGVGGSRPPQEEGEFHVLKDVEYRDQVEGLENESHRIVA
jgi:hypothetical protein